MAGRGTLTEEPDIPATVCLIHMRFAPCRKGMREGGCVLSENPEDIRAVAEYQSEDTAWGGKKPSASYEEWLNEGK